MAAICLVVWDALPALEGKPIAGMCAGRWLLSAPLLAANVGGTAGIGSRPSVDGSFLLFEKEVKCRNN